ncbi:MAG: dihydrolipoyl dehydrogenase family protein [Beijerinckiaceae bacterium]
MTDTRDPKLLTPDLCVIGAGAAGLSVAAAAAAFGVPVVLVEKSEMGGECLNAGCVPSKALIAAAQRAADARAGTAFGVDATVAIAPDRVFAHIRRTIAAIAPNDSVARYEAMGARVIQAPARFLDANTLEAGGHTIRARRFVIATGSKPAIPPIPGLTDTPFFTNETIFTINEIPRRLIIIGGGPIGMELAQAFRRLGSEVVVLEAKTALAAEDPELAAVAVTALRREGVDIREYARIESVAHADGEFTVHMAHGVRVTGAHLLVATGRRPALDGLDLPAAGVVIESGGITVDAKLRTSNKKIYAIGDCVAGYPRFTHAANAMAGAVVKNALFRLPAKIDRANLPRVTFTDPEIAGCGLSEAAAREQFKGVQILRWPFAENDRAQAEQAVEGHVKIIADRNGRVLGVGIVGKHAGEMLPLWTMMIAEHMKLRDVAETVFAYPLLGEAGKRAAMSAFTPLTRKPSVRRLIGFLRKFG